MNYLPGVNLWDPDDAHPSYAGSYLTASVIFSTVFNKAAKLQNYNGALNPTDAYKLRAFGDSSVFAANFHTRYNLGGIKKLDPVYSGGQLSLPGTFAKYSWYSNGVYISNAAALTLKSNGTYKAVVEENDGCIIKSCSYKEITTGISKEEQIKNLSVFPNPVTEGYFMIRSDEAIEQVEIFSLAGQSQKMEFENYKTELRVSTKNLPAGSYLLELKTKNQSTRKRILVE